MAIERDDSEQVKLNLRMHERLRARIEQDADKRGMSMNAAMVERLERSFDQEASLLETIEVAFGGKRTASVLQFFASVARQIEQSVGGKDWLDDYETFAAVRAAWGRELDKLAPGIPAEWQQLAHFIEETLDETDDERLKARLPAAKSMLERFDTATRERIAAKIAMAENRLKGA